MLNKKASFAKRPFSLKNVLLTDVTQKARTFSYVAPNGASSIILAHYYKYFAPIGALFTAATPR